MTLPTHIQTMLVGAGVMDTERVTGKARTRRCEGCRAPVVSALADDGPQVPGIRADVDAAPLTPLGELQATLLGRATFTRAGGGLTWRPASAMAALPAGSSSLRTVHAEHVCGAPPLDHLPAPTRVRTVDADPQNPPY